MKNYSQAAQRSNITLQRCACCGTAIGKVRLVARKSDLQKLSIYFDFPYCFSTHCYYRHKTLNFARV